MEVWLYHNCDQEQLVLAQSRTGNIAVSAYGHNVY